MAADAPEAKPESAKAGPRDLGTSPSRIDDPRIRHEYARAFIWAVTIGAVALTVYLSSALLALFGAIMFAAMIDGGARRLGRCLPTGAAGGGDRADPDLLFLTWWGGSRLDDLARGRAISRDYQAPA